VGWIFAPLPQRTATTTFWAPNSTGAVAVFTSSACGVASELAAQIAGQQETTIDQAAFAPAITSKACLDRQMRGAVGVCAVRNHQLFQKRTRARPMALLRHP
jgi:hypothetical protein